jgi:uncharacterized protein YndB with AHSA1/START domain
MSRAFEVAREIDLPASPEDVWTAITSGTDAWQFPSGMEFPADGTAPAEAPITTWDPPHRLVIRMESPDGTFNALDYAIEARDGGTAHLRYVHSGILSDEWEDQYDAVGPHTDFYFHTLGQYLQQFNGRPATYVGQPTAGIEGPASAGGPDAMEVLRAAVGLAPDTAVGEAVSATLGAAGPLDGVVDYSTADFLGVRTGDGLYRFFGRNRFGGVDVAGEQVGAHPDDAAAREAQLKAWLDGGYA